MKNFFPPQNQSYTYLQTNRSDDLGSLWSSFNLDFQTNLGAMKLSNKLVTNTTTSDDADLGTPCAFVAFENEWYAICDTTIFLSNSGGGSTDATYGFIEDTATGAVKTYSFYYSDLAVFNDRIWSTSADTLYSGTGSAWTSRDSLASNEIHKLCYFKKFDRLYYTYDQSSIYSIDTANVVSDTSDFSISLGHGAVEVTTMVSTSSLIWIGITKVQESSANEGTTGSILAWDGISAQVSSEYVLPTGGALAMTVLNDIPYAVDSEARILKFTGTSFEEVARLPVQRTLLIGATVTSGGKQPSGRFIHHNGLIPTKDNTLLVFVNNRNEDNDSTVNENLPSGVWEVDLSTGNCTHRYSVTLKPMASSTITDYGQNRIVAAGAIAYNSLATSVSRGRATLLLGAKYYTDATSTKSGIFIDSPAKPTTNVEGQKRGYFVTTWFYSNEIVDKWTRLWTMYRRFATSTDKMIFKFRLTEEEATLATITWTSTSTFTTTTDVTAYAPTVSPFNGTSGGEVEVIQGTGSGSCTHISSIVNNAGTYTVTLDTAVTGVTGTAKARFQKWRKLFPEVTGQVNSFAQMAIGDSNTRIQIKGVLEFTGDGEFQKLAIFSSEDIKIVA